MNKRHSLERPLGHDETTARLEALALAVSERRDVALAHAFAMTGPAGVGKFHTALWWTSRLKCVAPASCKGSCPSCKQVAAGSHPDLSVLVPSEKTGSIGIEEVRVVIRALGLKPIRRGPRIAIIRDAQALTVPAQNAMLKLLEEPPGFALIMLTTENLTALLPTIRSRCQTLRFAALHDEVIVRVLEQAGHTAELARKAASLAAGSVGRALALNEELLADREQLLVKLERFRSGAERDLEALVKELAERHKAGRQGLETLLEWQMRKVEASLGYVAWEGSEQLAEILSALAAEQSKTLLEEAAHTRQTLHSLSQHANLRLVIRDLLLDLRGP